MIVRVPGLLDAERLAAIETLLREASWEDGRATAGFQSAQVKHNLQLAPGSAAARQAGDIVVRALERHPDFISAALPRHVYPPLFNRYEPGMSSVSMWTTRCARFQVLLTGCGSTFPLRSF